LGVALKYVNECVGEKMVIAISFTVGAIHNAVYGFAHSKLLIFTATAFGTLTEMSFPTISAVKSNIVDETEQGRIQGALYSVNSLSAAIGPASMRFVYWHTKNGAYPGVMFLFLSFVYAIAVYFALILPEDRVNSRIIGDRKQFFYENADGSLGGDEDVKLLTASKHTRSTMSERSAIDGVSDYETMRGML